MTIHDRVTSADRVACHAYRLVFPLLMRICAAVDTWLRQAILALPDSPSPSSPQTLKLIENFKEKTGLLLRSFGGHLFFREIRDDGSFIDYEILHSDLAIQICDDEAAVYEINGAYVIDHTPETLGLKTDSETKN